MNVNYTNQNKIPISEDFERIFLLRVIEIIDEQIDEINERSRGRGFGGGDAYAEFILGQRQRSRLPSLYTQRDTPYFARVDYTDSTGSKNTLYIGTLGLELPSSFGASISAWQTPVASIFYQKKLGSTIHPTLGKIDVSLIRQFDIKKGTLLNFYDLEYKIHGYFDPILEARLNSSSAGAGLKDIVETIQGEQDTIIRTPKTTPLIIQGSAGSGKTTIALHRLAYLFYNHEQMKAEELIIFGPNKMFLKYVENVFPGLGIDNIEQKTFEEWCIERVDLRKMGLGLSDYFEQYNFLQQQSHEKRRVTYVKSKARSTMLFRDAIFQFLNHYQRKILVAEDFKVNTNSKYGVFEIKKETITKWFLEEYFRIPLLKRIAKIQDLVKNEFTFWVKKLSTKELELDDTIKRNMELKFRNEFNLYIKKWSRPNPFDIYCDFLQDSEGFVKYFSPYLTPNDLNFVIRHATVMKETKSVEHDDLAPLLFIQFLINGQIGLIEEEKQKDAQPLRLYHYAVVDEAQDYSPFQIYLIQSVVKPGCLMILGDLGQSIHTYRGIDDWEHFERPLSKQLKHQYIELSTSYRSTIEIINFSNKIIAPIADSKFSIAKPVGRKGFPPQVIKSNSNEEMEAQLIYTISILREKNYSSIAIITRQLSHVIPLRNRLLRQFTDIQAITDVSKEYIGGTVIIPAHLSKGMEYDAVVIYDVSDENYPDSNENRKVMYVACTRALHELYVLHSRTPSPIL